MIDRQELESDEQQIQSFSQRQCVIIYSQIIQKLYLEDNTAQQLIQQQHLTNLEISKNIEIYTALKDMLKQVSTTHRKFINASLELIFKNDSLAVEKQIRQINLQTAITIFADHYFTLVKDNSQSIILWKQFCKDGLKIKQQPLNQFCLRQIMPSSVYVQLRTLYEYMPKMFSTNQGQRIVNLYNDITKNNYLQQMMYKRGDELPVKESAINKVISNIQINEIITQEDKKTDVTNIKFQENILKKKNKKKNNKKKKRVSQANKSKTDNKSLIDLKWSQQEEQLLDFINNFQIQENQRMQCNVSQNFIKNLQQELKLYKEPSAFNRKNKNQNILSKV